MAVPRAVSVGRKKETGGLNRTPVSVGVEDGAEASPGTVWNGEFSNLGLIPEWNWPFFVPKFKKR